MKRLTWTAHVAPKCRRCGRPFRVSVEGIADMRRTIIYTDADSDADIAADLDLCLSCLNGVEVEGEHDTLSGADA